MAKSFNEVDRRAHNDFMALLEDDCYGSPPIPEEVLAGMLMAGISTKKLQEITTAIREAMEQRVAEAHYTADKD